MSNLSAALEEQHNNPTQFIWTSQSQQEGRRGEEIESKLLINWKKKVPYNLALV